MAKRKTYHVTKKRGGGWQGKLAGASKPSVTADTKEKAIERTRELAKKAPLGQIKIHRGDGVIQREHTYGEDPPQYKS